MYNPAGTAKTSPEEAANKAAPSLYEKNKLRIAGALNGFGDLTLLWDGYTEKKGVDKTHLKIAGWLYTAGAAVITFFGSVDKDKQIKGVFERTAEFLQEKGSKLSTGSKAAEVIKKQDKSMIAKTTRYLQRNAGQAMLWFYTLGAGAMLVGGIKGYKAKTGAAKKDAFADMLVGGFSLLVKGASFLLPEKADDSNAKENTVEKKGIIAWLKEKPMRLFGYGSMLTEAFWGYRAYQSKQSTDAAKARGEEDVKEEWQLKAATGASYAASDVVIATTNKDAANAVGKMDGKEQSELEEMVAETIAHQSEEKQEKLINQAAEFLEKESPVNGNAQELRQSIMQRVQQFKSWENRAIEAEQAEVAAAR